MPLVYRITDLFLILWAIHPILLLSRIAIYYSELLYNSLLKGYKY